MLGAEDLQSFCLDSGLGSRVSSIVAMALEEMAVYSLEDEHKNDLGQSDVLDVLVKINSDRVIMQVRSIGAPFDTTSATDERFSNIGVLKSISESVEFGYSLGMNHTTITLARGGVWARRAAEPTHFDAARPHSASGTQEALHVKPGPNRIAS